MTKHICAYVKLLLAWAGTTFSSFIADITLARVALILTITLTAIQLYITVRDKIIRNNRDKYRDYDI